MSSPSNRKKLLAVVLAPVIFIGLLEGVLRLAGFSYDPVAQGSVHSPHREWGQIDLYRQDPDLLWTLRPDSRLDDRERGFVEVRTNAAGLRGPALPGPKAPDEFRVLCLGDSITFGLALPEELAFPAQLERSLTAGRLGENHRVRVISGAVPGWSSVQGLRLLDRLPDIDPDVVVFWFGMNDAQPARVLPDVRLGPTGQAVVRSSNLLRSLSSFQLVQSLVHKAMGGLEQPYRVSAEEFKNVVRELRIREEQGGPRVLFVRCPNLLDQIVSQLEHVISRAKEEGVAKVCGSFPLLTHLRSAPPDADLTGRRDTLEGEPVLVFTPEQVEMVAEIEVVKGNLEVVERIRRGLAANLATLPGDSLSAGEVFGTAPRHEFFIDACHLSALGSRRAGESLARVIEKRMKTE